MTTNKEWPAGALRLVSREAYNATRRGRAYPYWTPEQRLEFALSYDRLTGRRPTSDKEAGK